MGGNCWRKRRFCPMARRCRMATCMRVTSTSLLSRAGLDEVVASTEGTDRDLQELQSNENLTRGGSHHPFQMSL